METTDIKHLCSELTVGASTIKGWIKVLAIPSVQRGKKLEFEPAAADLIRQVAQLRKEGYSLDQIADRLQPDTGPADRQQTGDRPAGGYQTDIGRIIDGLEPALTSAVMAAVQGQTELAQAYGAAQRQIGQLEAQLHAAQVQLAEAQETLKGLPAPGQLEAERQARQLAEDRAGHLSELQQRAQAEAEATRRELEQARQQIEEALAAAAAAESAADDARQRAEEAAGDLEQERKRGWWARLVGK